MLVALFTPLRVWRSLYYKALEKKRQPAAATSELLAAVGAGDGLQQSREVPLAR